MDILDEMGTKVTQGINNNLNSLRSTKGINLNFKFKTFCTKRIPGQDGYIRLSETVTSIHTKQNLLEKRHKKYNPVCLMMARTFPNQTRTLKKKKITGQPLL